MDQNYKQYQEENLKDRKIFRTLATITWIVFIFIVLFWSFGFAPKGSHIIWGLVILGTLGLVFIGLMFKKGKLPDEFKKVTEI